MFLTKSQSKIFEITDVRYGSMVLQTISMSKLIIHYSTSRQLNTAPVETGLTQVLV
jgi:hypothetical protein